MFERGRCVTQAESHYILLPESIPCCEGCLLTVLLSHFHLPVATFTIQRGKPRGTREFVEGVVVPWQGTRVLFGEIIQFAVIDTEPSVPIFLFPLDYWRRSRAVRRLDYSLLMHLLNSFTGFLALYQWLSSRGLTNRGSGACVYHMFR